MILELTDTIVSKVIHRFNDWLYDQLVTANLSKVTDSAVREVKKSLKTKPVTSSARRPVLLPAKRVYCKPEDQILEAPYVEVEVGMETRGTMWHLCGGFVTLQTVYTRDVFTYFEPSIT